jgi:hypothetical protein
MLAWLELASHGVVLFRRLCVAYAMVRMKLKDELR